MKIVIDIDDNLYTRLFDNGVDNYDDAVDMAKAIRKGTPLNSCKDCKYFETDVIAKVGEIPLIVGHEMCSKWGDGCKTNENGFCFLAERKGDKE